MFKKLYNSLIYSVDGLRASYKREPSIKIEAFLFPIMAFIAIYFGGDNTSKILMVMSLFIVVIAELLNSGIEKACDLVTMDHHELVKYAKDVGSAAVFLANILVVIVYSVLLFF